MSDFKRQSSPSKRARKKRADYKFWRRRQDKRQLQREKGS